MTNINMNKWVPKKVITHLDANSDISQEDLERDQVQNAVDFYNDIGYDTSIEREDINTVAKGIERFRNIYGPASESPESENHRNRHI